MNTVIVIDGKNVNLGPFPTNIMIATGFKSALEVATAARNFGRLVSPMRMDDVVEYLTWKDYE